MTDELPCLHRSAVTRTEIEAALPRCNQPTLEAMLRVIQLRLGTPDECPGDMDCAQMIAHRINNVLTAQKIGEALRRLDEA